MAETTWAAFWATYEIMKNVLPSLFIGLFLANVFNQGHIIFGGRHFIPLVTKMTGMPAACIFSVLLATVDRNAGMAAVAQAKEQEGVTDQEVIAANLAAKAPSSLQFFIFSFIPIMLSMYPKEIAVHFLLIYFLALFTISLLGIAYARLISPGLEHGNATIPDQERKNKAWFKIVKISIVRTWRPFVSMSMWMMGMSFVSMVAIKTGYLNRLTDFLPLLTTDNIDGIVLSLACTGFVSMIGGMAAVGAALHDGVISINIVVPLLLTIYMLHCCYDLLFGDLPRYIAIFGHRLGIKVALSGFIVTQIVMVATKALNNSGWL